MSGGHHLDREVAANNLGHRPPVGSRSTNWPRVLAEEDAGSSSPPEQFQRLVEAFADDIGAPPALGEVLEILSLAGGSAGFDAKLGSRNYRPSGPSRVAELNDNAFVE